MRYCQSGKQNLLLAKQNQIKNKNSAISLSKKLATVNTLYFIHDHCTQATNDRD